MPEITYVPKNFRGESLGIIRQANAIAAAYAQQGFDLTLRQMYYQFVARDLLPNSDKSYKRLGDIISDARLAGYLDWDFIVDRTRNLRSNSHWANPASIIRSAAQSFAQDKWAEQETYVEVWIEKDALVGVLDSVCPANDVPFFSCRGYTSQSEVWNAAQRLGEKIQAGKQVIIIHLGDHDPSGIDMSRDIEDRLRQFLNYDIYGVRFDPKAPWGRYDERNEVEYVEDQIDESLTIDRIALNMDQVQTYNPPPNPAKLTDARATKYIARHGPSSWELDALDPATLVGLIQIAIDSYKDDDVWQDAVAREERERLIITQAAENWAAVTEFLTNAA
jgi:hypothetical protein